MGASVETSIGCGLRASKEDAMKSTRIALIVCTAALIVLTMGGLGMAQQGTANGTGNGAKLRIQRVHVKWIAAHDGQQMYKEYCASCHGESAKGDGPAAPAQVRSLLNQQPPQKVAVERVTGIGGFFFRAHDPKKLAKWYQEHLGVLVVPTSYEQQPWRQDGGETAFAPLPENTNYFGDASKQWMINFRVLSLDKMVAQLRAAHIEVKIDPQNYPYGRFARLHDPEGNPIELWQPV
jgi:glyoxylase I family protein